MSSIQDLLADRGNVIGPNAAIVAPGPRGEPLLVDDPSSSGIVVHQTSSTTYIDASGHLHAVLFDEVSTIGGTPGSPTHTVLEILADVQVN
jgi:hypothetical protein